MAEYIVKGESLTAVADEIRVLSGTEEAMGLDAMTAHVGEANNEVDSQADLIAQIKSTVDNLPEAGSSGGNVSYDTCTVNINVVDGDFYGYCATCFDGSEIVYKYDFKSSNLGTITLTDVICGSPLTLIHLIGNGSILNTNITKVGSTMLRGSIWVAPNTNGAVATLHVGYGSGGAGN